MDKPHFFYKYLIISRFIACVSQIAVAVAPALAVVLRRVIILPLRLQHTSATRAHGGQLIVDVARTEGVAAVACHLVSGVDRRCSISTSVLHFISFVLLVLWYSLQCFDAVGWAAGRAFGL